jgi:hypothetical protein
VSAGYQCVWQRSVASIVTIPISAGDAADVLPRSRQLRRGSRRLDLDLDLTRDREPSTEHERRKLPVVSNLVLLGVTDVHAQIYVRRTARLGAGRAPENRDDRYCASHHRRTAADRDPSWRTRRFRSTTLAVQHSVTDLASAASMHRSD